MPKIGVAGPWLADYKNINGVISYENGFKLARMTEFSGEPDNTGESNDFYSDNGLSETERGTSSGSGTFTESVDNFDQEGSRRVLGVAENTIMVDDAEVTELVYDKHTQPGYFGHGIIIKKRKGGKDFWRAVVYTKAMYNIPPDAATTQGETIDWQAEELTATYMRDDSEDMRWKRESTFDDEKKATRYIETVLNIQPLAELAVTSEAGTETGNTKVTIKPALTSGNSYKYIVAPDVGLPAHNQKIGVEYADWDGKAEIAVSGKDLKILVVEVDSASRAQKAGLSVLTVNGG